MTELLVWSCAVVMEVPSISGFANFPKPPAYEFADPVCPTAIRSTPFPLS